MGKVGLSTRLWGRRAQFILLALAPSDETLPDLIIVIVGEKKRGGKISYTIHVPGPARPVINVPEQTLFGEAELHPLLASRMMGQWTRQKGDETVPVIAPCLPRGHRALGR